MDTQPWKEQGRSIPSEPQKARHPWRFYSTITLGALISFFGYRYHFQRMPDSTAERLRLAYVNYFREFPDSAAATRTANFLERPGTVSLTSFDLEMAESSILGLYQPYGPQAGTIQINIKHLNDSGHFSSNLSTDGPGMRGFVEETASLMVHETRHALDHRANPYLLACREGELLAYIDQTVFERDRVAAGKAPWMDSLNAKLPSGACSPWWSCPHPRDRRQLNRAYDKLAASPGTNLVHLGSWSRIKYLAEGLDRFSSYLSKGHTDNTYSVHADPERVASFLEEGLGVLERPDILDDLGVDAPPQKLKELLSLRLETSRKQIEIWRTPQRLAASRQYYDRALMESANLLAATQRFPGDK